MKRPRVALRRCLFCLALLLLAASGRSEVVRIEIDSREPLAGGHSFGDVGPYEKHLYIKEGFLLAADAEAIVHEAEGQRFSDDPMSRIVDAAGEYLAAAPGKKAKLEQQLRQYEGPVEPVISRLIAALPKRWEKTTGSLDDQHFTAPGLCEKYKDDLLYFFVPKDYSPSRPFGLLILMHGGGHGSPRKSARVAVASPEQMQSAYGFRPHIDNIPFISVAPSAPWNTENSARWNLPEADDYIDAVIRECGYRFNIDRDRVFLGGVSMGGFGAYHLCQRLADRIAGGIPCAGSWACSNWRCMIGTPLFIMHGSADAVAPGTPGEKARPRFTDVFFARAAHKLLSEAGVEHVYSEYKGGHWPRGEEKSVPEMVKWLEGKRRDPFCPRVVALTPRGWNATVDTETPHHRWVSILEVGDGRIDFDQVKRTGPGPKWKEPLEDFNKQGFELVKKPIGAGLVDARYQGDNRFEVATENVKKFSLWLHPKMVDFAKPVTVIVNGKQQTHQARPTFLDALRSYHRRTDWGLIYHCELAVAVE